MEALLERCSASLVRRLGGGAGETLVLERIKDEVRRMPYPHRQILASQFGIDRPPLGIPMIARRLGLPSSRVDKMLEEALIELGFVLIGAPPADTAIVGVVGRIDPAVLRGCEEAAA
jgi:hypothetical protein